MTRPGPGAALWRYAMTFVVGVAQGVAVAHHYQVTAVTVAACLWMCYVSLKA